MARLADGFGNGATSGAGLAHAARLGRCRLRGAGGAATGRARCASSARLRACASCSARAAAAACSRCSASAFALASRSALSRAALSRRAFSAARRLASASAVLSTGTGAPTVGSGCGSGRRRAGTGSGAAGGDDRRALDRGCARCRRRAAGTSMMIGAAAEAIGAGCGLATGATAGTTGAGGGAALALPQKHPGRDRRRRQRGDADDDDTLGLIRRCRHGRLHERVAVRRSPPAGGSRSRASGSGMSSGAVSSSDGGYHAGRRRRIRRDGRERRVGDRRRARARRRRRRARARRSPQRRDVGRAATGSCRSSRSSGCPACSEAALAADVVGARLVAERTVSGGGGEHRAASAAELSLVPVFGAADRALLGHAFTPRRSNSHGRERRYPRLQAVAISQRSRRWTMRQLCRAERSFVHAVCVLEGGSPAGRRRLGRRHGLQLVLSAPGGQAARAGAARAADACGAAAIPGRGRDRGRRSSSCAARR